MKFLSLILLIFFIPKLCFGTDDWEIGFAPYLDLYLKNGSELHQYGFEGSCGKYITIQADAIPVNSRFFEVTWMHELSSDGQIINKWPIPNDTSTISVTGGILTVSTLDNNQPLLDIKPDGKIRRSFLSLNDIPKPKYIDCPQRSSGLNEYEGCVNLQDRASGKLRIITVLSACT